MPVELDSKFLGLWLDEELLREEFDEIIAAGWSDERPTDRRVIRPRPPLPRRMSPVARHPRHHGVVRPPATTESTLAPARERGPPGRR